MDLAWPKIPFPEWDELLTALRSVGLGPSGLRHGDRDVPIIPYAIGALRQLVPGLRRRGRPPEDRCNGPLVRELREKFKLKREQFAEACGLEVWDIERAERSRCLTEPKFVRIAEALSRLTHREISPAHLKI